MPTSNPNSKNNKSNENQSNKSNNKNMNSGKVTTVKTPSAHDRASGMDEKRRGTSDSNGL